MVLRALFKCGSGTMPLQCLPWTWAARFQLLNLSFPPQKVGMFKVSHTGVLAESLRWHMESRAPGSCLEVDSSPGAGPVGPIRLVLVYPLLACPEHRSPQTAFSGIQEGTLPCPQRLCEDIPPVSVGFWAQSLL